MSNSLLLTEYNINFILKSYHTMTRQSGKESVHKLINDFKKNEKDFMSKTFQETETRTRMNITIQLNI